MKRLLCILSLLLLIITPAFSQADKLLGTWITADKKAHVEMYKSNDIYYGKIIWLAEQNDPVTGFYHCDEMFPMP